jgi:hypothetical protein
MTALLERSQTVVPVPATAPPDERPARRALLAQIERLERDLARVVADSWPSAGAAPLSAVGRPARPRLRDLGELEQIRDMLAARVEDARRDLRDRRRREAASRQLIGEMLRHPEDHRWRRVSRADIGEPGCGHWHVVPRLGLVGMLAGWWRVKISSGCPLAT